MIYLGVFINSIRLSLSLTVSVSFPLCLFLSLTQFSFSLCLSLSIPLSLSRSLSLSLSPSLSFYPRTLFFPVSLKPISSASLFLFIFVLSFPLTSVSLKASLFSPSLLSLFTCVYKKKTHSPHQYNISSSRYTINVVRQQYLVVILFFLEVHLALYSIGYRSFYSPI